MGTTMWFRSARDAVEWDALVSAHAGATGFHDWAWLTLQSECFGWRFEPLVVTSDGVPIGVFPVLLHRGVFARAVLPPFPFVGPLVPDHLLVAVMRAFRRWQLRHGILVARYDLGPGAASDPAAAVARAGVTGLPDRTFVVDLVGSSPERLVHAMKNGARQSLRRAERKGVVVRPSVPGEVTEFLPRILSESYSSRGVPSPYPEDIGARVERYAAVRDDVYTATALVDGTIAGVIVVFTGHPVVTGWAGGTLRAFRAVNPSTALYHDVLQHALDTGHTAVDLVGEVDEGISRFKLSLGAAERPFTTVVSSPLPPSVRAAALALRRRVTVHP
ncbi:MULTISPECIES: lipid II:glycine glycyltransferase FemX [Curtobacterium]|uniref:lipid II:glycine glycyltransferase FemX n=1 Tax=Curtobacterium flaccumfaciens TaxID=2035 RepID=UPI003EE79030